MSATDAHPVKMATLAEGVVEHRVGAVPAPHAPSHVEVFALGPVHGATVPPTTYRLHARPAGLTPELSASESGPPLFASAETRVRTVS